MAKLILEGGIFYVESDLPGKAGLDFWVQTFLFEKFFSKMCKAFECWTGLRGKGCDSYSPLKEKSKILMPIGKDGSLFLSPTVAKGPNAGGFIKKVRKERKISRFTWKTLYRGNAIPTEAPSWRSSIRFALNDDPGNNFQAFSKTSTKG